MKARPRCYRLASLLSSIHIPTTTRTLTNAQATALFVFLSPVAHSAPGGYWCSLISPPLLCSIEFALLYGTVHRQMLTFHILREPACQSILRRLVTKQHAKNLVP
eukprot:COSAG06_NODE_3671_length_5036_cov_3.267977_3_plen_105_part_00